MILNSFSELNASVCPGAFQELNGLTIVVPNDEQLPAPVSSPPQPFPPLPMPVEPDYAQGEDILMKALQAPFPNLGRGMPENANSNDVLRYLNLAPGDSDAETVSKFSAESSSSRDLPLPPLTPNLYQERRGLSISDVCGTTESITKDSLQKVGGKRKASSSGSSSKRCKVTQSSKFCHICVRSGEQVTLVPCANVIGAVCRKAVCHKCFEKHGYSHEWANACENREIIRQVHAGQLDRLPDNVWTCLHCRSMCPGSAQCKIYARTNKRRHMILKQRKAEKDRMIARRDESNGDVKLPKVIVTDLAGVRTGASTGVSTMSRTGGSGIEAGMPAQVVNGHNELMFRSPVPQQREAIEALSFPDVSRH